MADFDDEALGSGLPINRRDLIHGMAASAVGGAVLLPGATFPMQVMAQDTGSGQIGANYPPARSGMRGQHPGSFEAAHAARDGNFDGAIEAVDQNEHYDLVIVGAGVSGLAAAYFYRDALGDDRKILILDNHDDFGGHAKRNEFEYGGRTIISYGGTMSIESPFPYSFTAKGLLDSLGIELEKYESYLSDPYTDLQPATFFDREHFAADRTVVGTGEKPWDVFFQEAPLSPEVRADLTRLHTEAVDYLPNLSSAEKTEALRSMSYQDYLLQHAGLLPESLPYFFGRGYRNNKRVDTVPALEVALGAGSPGFAGMDIPRPITAHAPYFHWPDGNASLIRMLVSRLVPGVFREPLTQESVVLAQANYAALDRPANSTRVRLSSTVLRVEHLGDPVPENERAVRIVYAKGDRRVSVTAANVVMACFNNIIPYIAPELPAEQKSALAYPSKVPMQYTNVLLKNWQAWKNLGIKSIHAPNGYHTSVSLDIPMDIGGYRSALHPDEPIVVHMVRNPNHPGLPRKEQNRLGRMDMLATDFETVEREVRSQLQRMLGDGGFDAARDIAAITVNRWPHGYAYTYDTISDPHLPDEQRPHILGRRPFGRITIANADSGAAAYTNVAIDMAARAVRECLVSRGLT